MRRQVHCQIRRRRFLRHRIGPDRLDPGHGRVFAHDRRVAHDNGERYFRRAVGRSTATTTAIASRQLLLLFVQVVMVVWRRRFWPSAGRSSGRIGQAITAAAAAAASSNRGSLRSTVVYQQQVRTGVLFSSRTPSGDGLVERRRRSRHTGSGVGGGRGGPDRWHALGAPRQFWQHGLREPGTGALRLPLQVDQGLQVRQSTSRRRRRRCRRGGSGRVGGGGLSFAAVVKRVPPAYGFQEVLSGLPGRRPRQLGTRFIFQYAVFAFRRPPPVSGGGGRRRFRHHRRRRRPRQPLLPLVFDAFLELLGMFFHRRHRRPACVTCVETTTTTTTRTYQTRTDRRGRHVRFTTVGTTVALRALAKTHPRRRGVRVCAGRALRACSRQMARSASVPAAAGSSPSLLALPPPPTLTLFLLHSIHVYTLFHSFSLSLAPEFRRASFPFAARRRYIYGKTMGLGLIRAEPER